MGAFFPCSKSRKIRLDDNCGGGREGKKGEEEEEKERKEGNRENIGRRRGRKRRGVQSLIWTAVPVVSLFLIFIEKDLHDQVNGAEAPEGQRNRGRRRGNKSLAEKQRWTNWWRKKRKTKKRQKER